jgi:hypothetical protein
MTTLTRRLSTITSALSRRGGVNARTAGTTFCDGCGQVCTPDCRSAARLERARTSALRLSPIR